MIKQLLWIDTDNTYPYRNLAVEEYLTAHAAEGTCILFLWQNRRSVVVGRNQDCWKECRVRELEEDGGYLVRRLSGGGAVFHDLGNLNFTFMVRKSDYDVNRQLEVILQAVKLAGIQAEKTGRNDITADGRKFSGNAFYRTGDCCYHHGTLMLQVDKDLTAKYLNVSREKLASKGVDSVKSRVGNLRDFAPELTLEELKRNLIRAFEMVYGQKADELKEQELPQDEIEKLTERFASWEWKYGRKIPFSVETERRFPWGGVRLELAVNEGRVQDINIFSDAMEQAAIVDIAKRLKGCRYEVQELCRAAENAGALTETELPAEKGTGELWTAEASEALTAQMNRDIAELLRELL